MKSISLALIVALFTVGTTGVSIVAPAKSPDTTIDEHMINSVAKETVRKRQVADAIEEYKNSNKGRLDAAAKKIEEAKAVAEEGAASAKAAKAAGAEKAAADDAGAKEDGKADGKDGKDGKKEGGKDEKKEGKEGEEKKEEKAAE